jgi:N-acetylglucosaminyldiphosphoundecaprenol N-acetyl-beta-D-mannosaminyltransferase
MRFPKVRLVGISVNPVTKDQLLDFFRTSIEKQHKAVVGAHNMHSVYLAQSDKSIREFYKICDLAYVDGMPLVWMAEALDLPISSEHRVAFLDWYDDFFRMAAANKWRLFYLGGAAESSKGFENVLQEKYPGLQASVHHGYVRDFDVQTLCKQINKFKPHAVFVGMGMPIQEKFIVDALPFLKTNLIFAGGAMLEYLTGEECAAPRWMGPMGLEWLYRLVHSPKRLAYRYLVEPTKLFPLFVRELLQGREYENKRFMTKPEEALVCKAEK